MSSSDESLPTAKRHKTTPKIKGWKYVRDWYELSQKGTRDYDFNYPQLHAKCEQVVQRRIRRDLCGVREWLYADDTIISDYYEELVLYSAVQLKYVTWCSIPKPETPKYELNFPVYPKKSRAFLRELKPCYKSRHGIEPPCLGVYSVTHTLRDMCTNKQKEALMDYVTRLTHENISVIVSDIMMPVEQTYVISRVFRALPHKLWTGSRLYVAKKYKFLRMTPRIIPEIGQKLKTANWVRLVLDFKMAISDVKTEQTFMSLPKIMRVLHMETYWHHYQLLKHLQRSQLGTDVAFCVMQYCSAIEHAALSSWYQDFTRVSHNKL